MENLELYRWAVQDPETHAEVLRIMHEQASPPAPPTILREDFAGTSADSVAWLALQRPGAPRRAIAVDTDAPTLAWAYRRAQRLLGPRADALRFLQRDVLRLAPPDPPQADIIAALNFSALYLHDPGRLQEYLARAREGLRDHGILVLNCFGGPASIQPGVQRHAVTPTPRLPTEPAIAPFDYLWEIRSWDAARQRVDCRIHFDVPAPGAQAGVRRITDAFTYDFRVWTPDQLLTACLEAGFTAAQLWRHTYDPARGDQGVFLGPVDPDSLAALDSWTAYIVARR